MPGNDDGYGKGHRQLEQRRWLAAALLPRSCARRQRFAARGCSSFGTAIAGTILVSNLVLGNGTYVAAMIVLAVVALADLGIAIRLPANTLPSADSDVAPPVTASGALDTVV